MDMYTVAIKIIQPPPETVIIYMGMEWEWAKNAVDR